MKETLRYVTRRKNKNGSSRFYWQRKGFPLTALPSDRAERINRADALNAWADKRTSEDKKASRDSHNASPPPAKGSVAWVVGMYKQSPQWNKLKPASQKNYDRAFSEILKLSGPDCPWLVWDRRNCVDWVWSQKPGMRRIARAGLSQLFNTAMYHGLCDTNLASNMQLPAGNKRTEVWSETQQTTFLDACREHPHGAGISIAFQLLRYTAQRPGDVLAMDWNRFTSSGIRLVQQKTGKLLEVPPHPKLIEAIEMERERQAAFPIQSTKIVTFRSGRSVKAMDQSNFNRLFREIRDLAGLPSNLQPRDLRRTAAVRMAEARAEIHEIAAVGGWTIQNTTRILETYIPRNTSMAKNAINAWAEAEE